MEDWALLIDVIDGDGLTGVAVTGINKVEVCDKTGADDDDAIPTEDDACTVIVLLFSLKDFVGMTTVTV